MDRKKERKKERKKDRKCAFTLISAQNIFSAHEFTAHSCTLSLCGSVMEVIIWFTSSKSTVSLVQHTTVEQLRYEFCMTI